MCQQNNWVCQKFSLKSVFLLFLIRFLNVSHTPPQEDGLGQTRWRVREKRRRQSVACPGPGRPAVRGVPVSPSPGVSVSRCRRAPGSRNPSLRSRAGPGEAPPGPPGCFPAPAAAAGAGEAPAPSPPDRDVQGSQGPGRCGVGGETAVPRPCSGGLKSCHLQKVKKYGGKEHPAACWRLLFKRLWKPLFTIDRSTGSLRFADVWMLQVDTCQDPTDTCQDPICSACQFKITAFVAQHCNSDASSFRDFSFLSPVPQRYACCQSILSLIHFPSLHFWISGTAFFFLFLIT